MLDQEKCQFAEDEVGQIVNHNGVLWKHLHLKNQGCCQFEEALELAKPLTDGSPIVAQGEGKSYIEWRNIVLWNR